MRFASSMRFASPPQRCGGSRNPQNEPESPFQLTATALSKIPSRILGYCEPSVVEPHRAIIVSTERTGSWKLQAEGG